MFTKQHILAVTNNVHRQQIPSDYVLKGLKDDPTLLKEIGTEYVCSAINSDGMPCQGNEARLLHMTKGEDQGLQGYLICCECGSLQDKN